MTHDPWRVAVYGSFTVLKVSVDTANSPAIDPPAASDEIEVTPEMIEATIRLLHRFRFEDFDPRELDGYARELLELFVSFRRRSLATGP